jgi:nucleotide-binding universal stress UspA family protein
MAYARRFTVVIAVDLSDMIDTVLQHGLDIASERGPVDIHVISVVPLGRRPFRRTRGHEGEVEEREALLRPRVAEAMSAFAAPITRIEEWRVHMHVRLGVPAEEIIDLIDECRADVVVMGRHGWGGEGRGYFGSVSERVARRGHCSVLLAQPTDYEAPEGAREEACPECEQLREDSEGEQWFCERHHDGGHVGRVFLGPAVDLEPGGLF